MGLPFKINYFLPHQNNGHPLFAKSLWDDRLFFAGTETANVYGGYMDGAVHAAKRVANELKWKNRGPDTVFQIFANYSPIQLLRIFCIYFTYFYT